MGVLAQVLAQLAVAILQWIAGRQDLKNSVLRKAQLENNQLVIQALEWKTSAIGQPDGGASLRVRDGADEIKLPSSDTRANMQATGDK